LSLLTPLGTLVPTLSRLSFTIGLWLDAGKGFGRRRANVTGGPSCGHCLVMLRLRKPRDPQQVQGIAMNRLNLVDVETRWGLRTFELYHGDLTRLGFKVDVLAVSAFAGGYQPTTGTMLGALRDNCGISVKALAEQREFDFCQAFGAWVGRVVPPVYF